MTWPDTVLPFGVELTLPDIGQHDITDDVDRAGLAISRGRADEAALVGPGSLKFNLRNPTGEYTPRNPASSLYGQIGRNTPVLAYVELGAARLVQDGAAGEFATADKAALDVTGDIDLRVDIRPTTWRPSASAYIGLIKNSAYSLYITSAGKLVIFWYAGAVGKTLVSTVPIPGGTTGRKQVRATLDVNNGSGGHTARFYYWRDGAWGQFGDAVTGSGTTSIDNSTGSLRTFTNDELGFVSVYEVQVRSGIGGTLVANPRFTAQASHVPSFSDGLGNTWAASGTSKLWNRHYRSNAEVTEWPPRNSERGSIDAFTLIEASGTLRRLGQGQSPVRSPLRRGCDDLPSLVGYWPVEEGKRAESVSGTSRGLVFGTVAFAEYDELDASNPLPTINGGRLYFRVPPSASTGEAQMRFMLYLDAEPPDQTVLARVVTNNSLRRFDIVYGTGQSLKVLAYTYDNTLSATLGPVALSSYSLVGKAMRLSLECTQSGANVNFTLAGLSVGDESGWFTGATATGTTLGSFSQVDLNPNRAAVGDMAVGHVTVQSDVTSLFDLAAQINAYDGEAALTRMARLADENGLDLEVLSPGGESNRMGPQRIATLLDLLRDCEAVDGGVLYEPDTGYELAYRPLDAITRQDPLALTYVENQYKPLEPTDDDQGTRNDVTVTCQDGGSGRVVDEDGPLGVYTIGRYDEGVTLPLAADADAIHQAGWRVSLGTVDDSRWPTIGFDLADPRIAADPDLMLSLLELEIGDRLRVNDLPEWFPPFPADVIVQGINETLLPLRYPVELTTSPAQPFDVVALDDEARWDNDTSTLASGVSAGTTSFSVATADPPLWTHADGDFEMVVGGEVVTVTAVSGSSSPQTLTVVRSVNGVSKAHSSGAPISLYRPSRWAL